MEILGIRGNITPKIHSSITTSSRFSHQPEQTVSPALRMKSLLVPAGLLSLVLLAPGLGEPQFPGLGLGAFGAHFGAPGPFLPPRPASPPTLQFQIPPGRILNDIFFLTFIFFSPFSSIYFSPDIRHVRPDLYGVRHPGRQPDLLLAGDGAQGGGAGGEAGGAGPRHCLRPHKRCLRPPAPRQSPGEGLNQIVPSPCPNKS